MRRLRHIFFLPIAIGALTIISPTISYACDICSAYVSPSLDDTRNSLGVYYRHRLMKGQYDLFGRQTLTKHAAHGNDINFWGNDVSETYNTIELRGSFFIKKRWKTSVILPYLVNTQFINNNRRFRLNGFGDPTVLQEFILVQSDDLCQSNYGINIGAGVKFPLGKTTLKVADVMPNLDLQPGSGSLDYMGLLTGFFRKDKLSIEGVSSIKINGFNQDNYRYGTSINARLDIGTKVDFGTRFIIPYIGTYNEFAFYDESTIQHRDTGGEVYYINVGGKFYNNEKWMLFADFQYALKNNLNGNNQLVTRYRFNSGIRVFF